MNSTKSEKVKSLKNKKIQDRYNSNNESPFGPTIMLGLGPTRQGKSYLKDIIDSHFVDYQKNSSVIDIGPDFESFIQNFKKNEIKEVK